MQVVKDTKRRGVQWVLQNTGFAAPDVKDEQFDELNRLFTDMTNDLNELGSGIATCLKDTSMSFKTSKKLARVLNKFYAVNGEFNRAWPGVNPMASLHQHHIVAQYKDTWLEADEKYRSSAAYICVSQALNQLRAFQNNIVPDIKGKVDLRANAYLDVNTYQRRAKSKAKMKQHKQDELDAKLRHAEELYAKRNGEVRDELEKVKIARDELLEESVITLLVCQAEMYKDMSNRLNQLVSQLPQDKVVRLQRMIGDQVARGGYKVQVRGQTDAEKFGNVLLGKQDASVLKAETDEQVAERERLQREAIERDKKIVEREEKTRAQGPSVGRVSMPGQPAAAVPVPTPASMPPVTEIRAPPMTAVVCKARAMFDCEAETEGDLSFKAGDVIAVTKKDDSGWWEGTCNGLMGTFPANYVEET